MALKFYSEFDDELGLDGDDSPAMLSPGLPQSSDTDLPIDWRSLAVDPLHNTTFLDHPPLTEPLTQNGDLNSLLESPPLASDQQVGKYKLLKLKQVGSQKMKREDWVRLVVDETIEEDCLRLGQPLGVSQRDSITKTRQQALTTALGKYLKHICPGTIQPEESEWSEKWTPKKNETPKGERFVDAAFSCELLNCLNVRFDLNLERPPWLPPSSSSSSSSSSPSSSYLSFPSPSSSSFSPSSSSFSPQNDSDAGTTIPPSPSSSSSSSSVLPNFGTNLAMPPLSPSSSSSSSRYESHANVATSPLLPSFPPLPDAFSSSLSHPDNSTFSKRAARPDEEVIEVAESSPAKRPHSAATAGDVAHNQSKFTGEIDGSCLGSIVEYGSRPIGRTVYTGCEF